MDIVAGMRKKKEEHQEAIQEEEMKTKRAEIKKKSAEAEEKERMDAQRYEDNKKRRQQELKKQGYRNHTDCYKSWSGWQNWGIHGDGHQGGPSSHGGGGNGAASSSSSTDQMPQTIQETFPWTVLCKSFFEKKWAYFANCKQCGWRSYVNQLLGFSS